MALILIQIYVAETDRTKMRELVADDKFTNMSEFVRFAIKEKLEREMNVQ